MEPVNETSGSSVLKSWGEYVWYAMIAVVVVAIVARGCDFEVEVTSTPGSPPAPQYPERYRSCETAVDGLILTEGVEGDAASWRAWRIYDCVSGSGR